MIRKTYEQNDRFFIRVSKATARKLFNSYHDIIVTGKDKIYKWGVSTGYSVRYENGYNRTFDECIEQLPIIAAEYYIPVTKRGYIEYRLNGGLDSFISTMKAYDYSYIDYVRK